MDRSALFFVEDEEDKPLRAILRQWPDLSRPIAVCRCFGIDNLPRDKLLESNSSPAADVGARQATAWLLGTAVRAGASRK